MIIADVIKTKKITEKKLKKHESLPYDLFQHQSISPVRQEIVQQIEHKDVHYVEVN